MKHHYLSKSILNKNNVIHYSCLILFILSILNSHTIYSQNLNSVFKYDTTILVPQINKPHSLFRTVSSFIYKDFLYFTHVDKINKSKIQIHTLDLKNHKSSIKELSTKPYKNLLNENSFINGISINSNYLIINWSDFFAMYIRNRNNRFTFFKTFSIKHQKYEYINFIADSLLLLGACYNSHPLSSKNKAYLTVYNVANSDSLFSKSIDFKDIEFTHFTPGKWITATTNYVFFANTSDYSIQVFDSSLNEHQLLTNSIENWSKTPDSLLINIRKKTRDIGKLLNILSAYNYDKINRLEETWTINDSTLFVQYFEPGKEKYLQNRYCDLYKLSQNGQWYLAKEKLLNGSLDTAGKQLIDTSLTITKDNWSINSYNYAHTFGYNYLVIFDTTTPLPKVGLKYSERYKRDQEYYKTNPALFGIYIFKYVE